MGFFSKFFETEKVVDSNTLQNRGRNGSEQYFEPNQSKPFNGKEIEQYENGQNKFEHTYEDGRKNGLSTWWHKNGNIKIQKNYWRGFVHQEINYEDGLKNGKTTTWRDTEDNSNISSIETFKDGQQHGLSTYFYYNETNSIRKETNYYHGKLHGLFTEYYENGKKSRENTYKYGKSDGSFSEWEENGKLKYAIYYENGKKIK